MYNKSILSPAEIVQNYQSVKEKISKAAESVLRSADDITLIVVTKTFDFDTIKPIIDIGHIDFGENKVQEADLKWLEHLQNNTSCRLHLIGHLQTNKVKRAMQIFHSIHTVDSMKRINEIEKFKGDVSSITEDFFFEINMAMEENKSGFSQSELELLLSGSNNYHSQNYKGLMCIPPFAEEPSPYFMFLAKIASKYNLQNLSMGMSADFEKAIQFGATHIRVGSEIFGARQ